MWPETPILESLTITNDLRKQGDPVPSSTSNYYILTNIDHILWRRHFTFLSMIFFYSLVARDKPNRNFKVFYLNSFFLKGKFCGTLYVIASDFEVHYLDSRFDFVEHYCPHIIGYQIFWNGIGYYISFWGTVWDLTSDFLETLLDTASDFE